MRTLLCYRYEAHQLLHTEATRLHRVCAWHSSCPGLAGADVMPAGQWTSAVGGPCCNTSSVSEITTTSEAQRCCKRARWRLETTTRLRRQQECIGWTIDTEHGAPKAGGALAVAADGSTHSACPSAGWGLQADFKSVDSKAREGGDPVHSMYCIRVITCQLAFGKLPLLVHHPPTDCAEALTCMSSFDLPQLARCMHTILLHMLAQHTYSVCSS